MVTNSQNSKHIVHEKLPVAQDLRFALIVSQWNSEITNRLYEGAHQILQQQQAKQIDRIDVPGSFELVYASRVAIKKNYASSSIAPAARNPNAGRPSMAPVAKNFAVVICRNSKTRSGAEVIIKWRNKDLFNIQ